MPLAARDIEDSVNVYPK